MLGLLPDIPCSRHAPCLRHSANPDIPAGQTIVIGTQEGLYARVQALEQLVLHISSTNDQGEEVGSLELPLEPKALLKGECGSTADLIPIIRTCLHTTQEV